MYNQT